MIDLTKLVYTGDFSHLIQCNFQFSAILVQFIA